MNNIKNSLIFITGLVIRDGDKVLYTFTWPTILLLFIALISILWLIKYLTKV